MKKVLGRGLSALIPDSYINKEKSESVGQVAAVSHPLQTRSPSGFEMIPLEQIKTNEDQPRKVFDEEKIQELAASIREKGILQPVVVKKVGEASYILICGERRFRAAEVCGLKAIPAVVKDVANDDFLEWALIENIQRQDLNALEEAEAYRRLAEERMLSHDDIAKRLGKSRVTVTNILRLLRLPEEIQRMMNEDRLSAGHARALLGLPSPEHQRQMARRIVEENLSVRQIEAIVNRSNAHKRNARKARQLSPEISDLEIRLTRHFGTHVKIYPRKNQKQGRLELYYYSLDDFDRILQKVQLPSE